MINIKSKEEINKIAKSGKIAAFVLKQLQKYIKPGITTHELDKIARRIIESRNATPSFLDYQGYPASTCISINDELVHGIPSSKIIKKGDLVKIDVGVNYEGYHSDTAITVYVGRPDKETLRLINGVKQALFESIKVLKPGIKVGLIEKKTGDTLKKFGLSPVMSLSGHGVGRQVHEEPSIRSDGDETKGDIVKAGMVFAIEPMATLGSGLVKTASDRWTVRSSDHTLAAHFEHTVEVTNSGCKILTA